MLFWYNIIRFFKKTKTLDFSTKNWAETKRTECKEEIKEDFSKIFNEFPAIKEKIFNKHRKETVSLTYKDLLGNKELLTHPIFTDNEIARIKFYRGLYYSMAFLFILFEGFLYAMISRLFIPDAVPLIQIIFGLAFAFVFILTLHFAFKKYYEYIEAKEIVRKKNMDPEDLEKFKQGQYQGIMLFGIFVVVNIASAWVRAVFLEPGTTDDSFSLGTPLLILSLGLTFLTAVVLGFIEQELVKTSELYKAYRVWRKNNKERLKYFEKISVMQKKAMDVLYIKTDKYWQLVLDLNRRFLEREVDPKFEEKKKEYEDLRDRGEISREDFINDKEQKLFMKYYPIMSCDESIFTYGIINDKEIRDYFDMLEPLKKEMEAFHERSLEDFYSQKQQVEKDEQVDEPESNETKTEHEEAPQSPKRKPETYPHSRTITATNENKE